MGKIYRIKTVTNDHHEIHEKEPGKPLTIHSVHDNLEEAERIVDELRNQESELKRKPSQREVIDWFSDTFRKLK